MRKENGGPAFPFTAVHVGDTGVVEAKMKGMSLRTWLAGQALAGMSSQTGMDDLATRCVCLADAVIAKLNEEQP